MRVIRALFVLAFVAACCSAARPGSFDEERRAVTDLVQRAKQQQTGAGGSNYKNTQPIIGILTQPCTDCPGR